MKRIEKEEPAFFSDFVKKRNPSVWGDLTPIYPQLKENLLKKEQGGHCAYCNADIIDKPSHIDHLKKRHFFPKTTFSYDNLFISCNKSSHCASYKDGSKSKLTKEENERLINPALEDPRDHFEYAFDGTILVKNDSKKAKLTINKLNLNENALLERRKTIARGIDQFGESILHMEEDEIVRIFGEFENFVRSIVEAYERRDNHDS